MDAERLMQIREQVMKLSMELREAANADGLNTAYQFSVFEREQLTNAADGLYDVDVALACVDP